MERRKFLIATGSLAAGSAAAVGTGAFNFANVERTVSVDVVGDSNAFLALDTDSAYANTDGGTLEVTFNDDADVDGTGVNADSDYSFRNVFNITNQGSQDVVVWLQDFQSGDDPGTEPGSDEPVLWYTDGFSTLIEGSGNAVTVAQGETISISAVVLLRNNSADDLPDKLRVYADASGA